MFLFRVIVLATLASSSVCAQQKEVIETPLARGTMIDGRTVGLWEYYDTPEELALRIDYTKGKLLYVHPDTSTFTYIKNGMVTTGKLKVPCRFHGPEVLLIEELGKKFSIPRDAYRMAPTTFGLMFEVHSDGIARNPTVLNESKKIIKDELLKDFNEIPNIWIAGRDEEGPVTCLFAVDFVLCNELCPEVKASSGKAKSIFSIYGHKAGVTPSNRKLEVPRNEISAYDFVNRGLLWSPNDTHIFLTTSNVSHNYFRQMDQKGLILNVATGNEIVIPYAGIGRTTWIDENRLFFRYKYSLLPERLVSYDLSTGKISTPHDTKTSAYHMPSWAGKVAFLNLSADSVKVCNLDPRTNKVDTLMRYANPPAMFPLQWSPDGQYVILMKTKQKNDIDLLELHSLENKSKQAIPLIDVTPLGWTKDNDEVYLAKFSQPSFEVQLSLYKYSVKTEELTKIFEKRKGIDHLAYSHEAGLFLIAKKNEIYLTDDPSKDLKEPILRDATLSSWSHAGDRIAYISAKDNQLYVYDINKKQSNKISNWIDTTSK